VVVGADGVATHGDAVVLGDVARVVEGLGVPVGASVVDERLAVPSAASSALLLTNAATTTTTSANTSATATPAMIRPRLGPWSP
jgi:hypothetical protein